MGGSGQKDEALCLSRMIQREGSRHRTAEGMGDDDRLLNAKVLHQGGKRRGLTRLRVVASAALRPAVSRPVDEEKFRVAFEPWTKRQHLVEQIAARAVQEDDGRKVGSAGAGHVHIVDGCAADLGEAADRLVAPFDQPRASPGQPHQNENQGQKEGYEGVGKVHATEVRRPPDFGRPVVMPASCRTKATMA